MFCKGPYYEILKEKLINKGVDESLLEMPAIRERLEEYIGDDFSINSDGTFNFGSHSIKRINLNNESLIEIQTVYEIKENRSYSMDNDMGLESREYIDTEIELTHIDEAGVEIEKKKKRAIGKAEEYFNKDFNDIKCPILETISRKNGVISYSEQGGSRKTEAYDKGKWELDITDLEWLGTKEGESIAKTLNSYDTNTDKLLSKYPHLKTNSEKRKEQLIEAIDTRTESRLEELEELKTSNTELTKMLKRALSFAELVRNSSVGKLFFGRKAKEVLGEKNKNTKQLPEGRDD